MSKLKCYRAGSYDPFEFDFVAVCFAPDRNTAKNLMWNKTNLAEECQDDWHLARVIRDKSGDKYASESESCAYVVRDDKTLRLLGFMNEGDRVCDSCGLAEMGGMHPVCTECCQCDECGCDCD